MSPYCLLGSSSGSAWDDHDSREPAVEKATRLDSGHTRATPASLSVSYRLCISAREQNSSCCGDSTAGSVVGLCHLQRPGGGGVSRIQGQQSVPQVRNPGHRSLRGGILSLGHVGIHRWKA